MVKKAILILILLIIPFQVNAETKSIIDITNTDIFEIQENIDKGYLSYETLVNLYLDRIEEYNKMYNAIISVNKDAVSIARKLDEEFKKNGRRSILHGIPIVLKDNIDYVGLPTTIGTKALKDSIPYNNAKVVKNLIDAGAIIIAKSNMSEFAFSALNSKSSYGHVYNAFDINYTPYGSSGGSTVAVAASFATMSLGTDTNSSIRLPASANNVVGLRPTYDLISLDGIVAYDITRDTVGPITKSVSENALLLTAMANNGIDYTDYLNKDGLNGKNIGVVVDFIKKQDSNVRVLKGYYKEVDELTKKAVQIMENEGANIIYLEDFYSSYYDSLFDKSVLGISMCYQFNSYIKNTSSKIKSFQDLINNGGYIQPLSGYNSNCYSDITKSNYYDKILNYKKEFIDYVDKIIKEYDLDVFLYPSSKIKTLAMKEINNSRVTAACYTISPMTGMPALVVPMGFDSNGLPYGIELVANKNREDILYEIAYAYEQKTKFYKNPEIAPNLYTIPDNISELIKYYEKGKLYKNLYTEDSYSVYLNTINKIKLFFENYNNESFDKIDVLIKEYQKSVKGLKFHSYIYYIFWALLFIFIFNLTFKKKKRRKRKAHK